jgi:hypothetical protein
MAVRAVSLLLLRAATPADHVGDVFLLRTLVQVIRIDAQLDVAVVIGLESGTDRTL